MQHLGRPHYVALLSAAALWGAGHQQPMAFQVITDSVERNMKSGRVRNLKYMRALARELPVGSIGQQLAAQLPWFHSCTIGQQLVAQIP